MIFRKRQQSLEIIIGPESSVTGSLSTRGIARIDGNVEGNVTADWLIVGETGCMRGDVVSRGTMVAGRLEGNIRSDESVEIGSKGIVEGDIYTTKLSISEGAFFEGHSYMPRVRIVESDSGEVLSFQKGGKPSLGATAESGSFDKPWSLDRLSEKQGEGAQEKATKKRLTTRRRKWQLSSPLRGTTPKRR